eukprot:g3073.t1
MRTPNPDHNVRVRPSNSMIDEQDQFQTILPHVGNTFGQVPGPTVVTGKPLPSDYVAMGSLQVPRNSDSEQSLTIPEAEALVKQWKGDKLVFIAWFCANVLFTVMYVIFLRGIALALAFGVIMNYIAVLMYLSPWFKSTNGVFAIFVFIVGTFISDFILAFLSLVFGLNDSTILACGALILCHSSLAFMLFRRHQGVLDAMELLEREPPLHVTQITTQSYDPAY